MARLCESITVTSMRPWNNVCVNAGVATTIASINAIRMRRMRTSGAEAAIAIPFGHHTTVPPGTRVQHFATGRDVTIQRNARRYPGIQISTALVSGRPAAIVEDGDVDVVEIGGYLERVSRSGPRHRLPIAGRLHRLPERGVPDADGHRKVPLIGAPAVPHQLLFVVEGQFEHRQCGAPQVLIEHGCQ